MHVVSCFIDQSQLYNSDRTPQSLFFAVFAAQIISMFVLVHPLLPLRSLLFRLSRDLKVTKSAYNVYV